MGKGSFERATMYYLLGIFYCRLYCLYSWLGTSWFNGNCNSSGNFSYNCCSTGCTFGKKISKILNFETTT